MSPPSATTAPSTQPNSTPSFCFKGTRLPQRAAVGATRAASWPPLTGSPLAPPKPSRLETVAGAPRQQELPREGRGGDSHCAACSRGHRRCRRGPRWRFGAIRWWLSSDNSHNRCRLSWRPTGGGGRRQQAGLSRPTSTPLPGPHPKPLRQEPGNLTGEPKHLRSRGTLESETDAIAEL